MSIATLKKKTQAKYNNISVNQSQFSLNGTLRNQGYVGQTSLSRSLPKTLMKGDTIKGHGGCCGQYPVLPVVQSAVTSLNDPNIVKPSVLGTEGLIETKYRWIKRPQPYTVVKPDNNRHLGTQQDYIKNKAKKAVSISCPAITTHKPITGCPPTSKKNQCIVTTQPASTIVAKSQGQHLLELNKMCTENDNPYVPSELRREPIVGN